MDARAAGLWSEFVHKVGPVAERFGRTMPPPTVPGSADRDANQYLEEAATSVSYVAPARPLTGGTTALFGLFGAAGGGLGAAAHHLLRGAGHAAGGDWQTALPVLALFALLLGPLLAVLAAKRVADRRGVGLNAAAVTTVLLAALLTAGVVYAALTATPAP